MKTNREFASDLVWIALRNGAEQAEAYIKSSKNLSLEVKNQELDAVESSLSFGYSLRVIRDGKLGFSYSTSPDESESVIRNAIEAAKWADADEYLDMPRAARGSPQAMEYASLEVFDGKGWDIKEDEAVKHVLIIEKAANDFDKRIKKTRKATGTFSSGEIFILNSKGIDISYPYTKFTAQVMTVAEENGESQMGWDFNGSRVLQDVSFEDVGRIAAKRAVQMLGAKRINTVKAPIILDNSVSAEFLGIFASSFSAESVQKGRSLLKDKIGQRVISPKVNLIDSGIIPRRLGTRPFDDEGVLTSEKVLIKEGALQGFLHNTYTAKRRVAFHRQCSARRIHGASISGNIKSVPENVFRIRCHTLQHSHFIYGQRALHNRGNGSAYGKSHNRRIFHRSFGAMDRKRNNQIPCKRGCDLRRHARPF